MLMNELENLPP